MNNTENKKLKIGFIGCGKMASAIISGIINSKFIAKENVQGSEVNCDIADSAKQRLGIDVITDNSALTINSDVIFIATKPNFASDVLDEIKDELTEKKLVVSIAAGVSTSKIENIVGHNRVIRVMPNTPAFVLTGMSGVCKGKYASEEDVTFVMNLLSNIGKCIEVTENQMDIVTAISGSGPAFFYKVIEDMARAGEKLGLEYEKSLTLATQTALGSAKMIFNRGDVPVQTLIDNVSTKGGCTFVGTSVMYDKNSENLFYEVIKQTAEKAHELGK
ncbi:MAG: pyrroline-5-carboxylate reductase [Clostridiaceae bacterium]|jgi:pyrroline-5-carboxylate reductase|nr:pyrroline-5-carboxylate reductase [Clostridiaceae bacterium]